MELDKYGFESEYNELRCRICKGRIPKFSYCYLLGVYVKYGYCRWWTHGISVCRALKEQNPDSASSHAYTNIQQIQRQTRLFEPANTEK